MWALHTIYPCSASPACSLMRTAVRRPLPAFRQPLACGLLSLALVLAVRGNDTLWSRAPLALAGTVVDSASGLDLSGAFVTCMGARLAAVSDSSGQFTMPSVLSPPEYSTLNSQCGVLVIWTRR
jgi:hypothetical protein